MNKIPALDNWKRYLVILADREKMRFFTIHLGKIEETKEIIDDQVPQRVKAHTINLGRTDKIMRHIEYHLNEHLKLVAKEAKNFVKGKKIDLVVIGGHKEMLHKIRKHLLYPLNKKVLGEFVTELNIPLSKISYRIQRL